MIGLVHLGNTIRQHRPLAPGERVRVEVRPRRLFLHARGQTFGIETAIMRAGVVVWESLSTYLRVGVPSPQGVPLVALPTVAGLSPDGRWDAPADTGRRYARVSGDWNPIHVSGLGAWLFGFAHPIAHGMWTKARALAALLPAEPSHRPRWRPSSRRRCRCRARPCCGRPARRSMTPAAARSRCANRTPANRICAAC